MREIATIEPLGGDDMELVGVASFAVVLLLGLSVIVTFVVLGIVLIKALIRYIRSKDVRVGRCKQAGGFQMGERNV